jgi:lipoate-protein ligase A
MHRLDPALPSPAENLALDDVLLDLSENGQGGENLVFWEPREVFVVIGYAIKVATEVNVPVCEARMVPIFRRCSGGGTVVQMPGGLNYSLILAIHEDGPTRNITTTNQYIMERNRRAIEQALRTSAPGGQAPEVTVRGHTDLCLGDVKFAGNSQRRRKHFLIFHGTLLLNCDLALISELLLMPSLQPDYRANRPHRDFVTNLNLPAETVKTTLAREWGADETIKNPPLAEISRLAREKYSSREWNFKF